MSDTKTVAFHTLGCKLNFSETSTISRMLEKDGFEKIDFDGFADVYVINTCSVTENADRECRLLVRRIQRKAPESLVVIMGCYAQLKPQEIASIPGVDLVLGASEKFNMAAHLKTLVKGDPAKVCSCDIEEVEGFYPSYSMLDRTRAFLKVQDGCDYNCSFCTIPMARGKSRSDSIENAISNAKALASGGVKEIVLTGVNLGDFRTTIFDPATGKNRFHSGFFDLIKALDELDCVERFRISSIEPNLLSEEIIEFVARSRRFMPHFHIPLQSGNNQVLGLMRRRYKKEGYADRVRLIRQMMPHCAIGADVIVGFPGETNEAFADTYSFLADLDVSYLHVFTYSERDHTKALEIKPVVPVRVRNERNKQLRLLSFRKSEAFRQQHEGATRKVLFERHPKDGMMDGYTDNYIKVTSPYREEWVNQVIDWAL